MNIDTEVASVFYLNWFILLTSLLMIKHYNLNSLYVQEEVLYVFLYIKKQSKCIYLQNFLLPKANFLSKNDFFNLQFQDF